MAIKSDTTLDYESIINLSQSEIRERMRDNPDFAATVPHKGTEFNNFATFASMEPGSEDRKQFIAKLNGTDDTPTDPPQPEPAPEPAPEPPPVEPPAPQPPEPAPEPSEPPATPNEDFAGYGSQEELVNGVSKLREQNLRMQERLDQFNAERGNEGRRVQSLEEQLAATREENERLKNAKPEPKPAAIKRPVPPNPADFDAGVVDEGYAEAYTQYHQDMDAYSTALEERVANVEKVIPKVNQTVEFVANTQQSAQQQEFESRWGSLWGDVKDIQDNYEGMQTTVPFKQIDDQISLAKSGNQQANAYVNSLPESDRQAHARITKVIKTLYDTRTEGGPTRNQMHNIDSAFVFNGINANKKQAAPAPAPVPANPQGVPQNVTKEQVSTVKNNLLNGNDSNNVQVPSAANHTLHDDTHNELNPMSTEEKMDRLNSLHASYSTAVKANRVGHRQGLKDFESSPKFLEMHKLAKELGVRLPRPRSTQ